MAPRRWQVLTAICTAVFLGAIDFYIVSIAVPDMLRSFGHVGIAEISWVINGYAVTFTAMPTWPKLRSMSGTAMLTM